MSDDVTLTIGRRVYGGWESVDTTSSIETIAGGFSLRVTERWPGQQDRAAIAQFDACTLAIGDETVITGAVDDISPEYDATTHSVGVTGRDATGDLVDCSAEYIGGQRFNADPVALISSIAEKFGIAVMSQIAGLKPIPEFVVHPGQTAFEAIQQICSYSAVLPISDGKGNLVLTRAGLGGTHTGLQLGRNILRGRGRFSAKERFSDYRVIGQANGSGNVDPATAIGGNGTAFDPGVPRHRPLIIVADFMAVGNDAYAQRAMWEAAVRAGRAYGAVYTVQGWRDDNGQLWGINRTLPVDDDWLGFHETLLISGVHRIKGDKGSFTELTVTRPQAFALIAQPVDGAVYDPTPSGRPVSR